MHYLDIRPANDTSGIKLRLTDQAVPYSAGMVAFAAAFSIPPHEPSTLVPNSCCYSGWEPLHGFATRVHTHGLGREVYLDRSRPTDRSALERVVGLDPQQPQGFYPVQPEVTFLPGDELGMACNFDSSDVGHMVHAGHTSSDEMCNLYMMLYSHLPFFMWCLDSHPGITLSGPGGLPTGAVLQPEVHLWQPPATLAGTGTAGTAGEEFPLGQVSGLASRGDGTVWAFHRGRRAWNTDGSVSDGGGKQGDVLEGPVVLQLAEDTGEVIHSWGNGTFVLPHMITLDHEGNLWLTDVGLHQVFKFSPAGKQLMVLGQARKSGTAHDSFCKPTQVAPARDGSVFVSDGYCNSRVAEFDGQGAWVRDYTLPKDQEPLLLPHSVVYDECRKLVIVAERERGRVHAFERGGVYRGLWDLSEKYGNPYSLVIGPYGAVLALTWQPAAGKTWVVVLDANVGDILRAYEVPGNLELPHDLALAPAPLELTGSGERQLAIVISETKDGKNLHKYVLAALAPAGGVDSRRDVADKDGGELAAAELAELEAAKAAAAAHFGGSHKGHQHGQQQGTAGAEVEQAGGAEDEEAPHVGHALVKPVGEEAQEQQQKEQQKEQQQDQPGDSPQEEEEEEGPEEAGKGQPGGSGSGSSSDSGSDEGGAEEASRVGHSMVKPVGEELQSKAAKKEPQPAEKQEAEDGTAVAAAAAAAAKQQKKEQQQKKHQEEEEELKKQQEEEEELKKQQEEENEQKKQQEQQEQKKQHEQEQQEQQGQQAQRREEDGLEGEDAEAALLAAEDKAAAKAAQALAQQQQQQEEQAQEEAEAAAAGAAAGGKGRHGREHRGLGRSEAQPWALGLVFVGVALFSWSRLQRWRGHSGAGYHAASSGDSSAPAGIAAAPQGPAPHRHHLVHGHPTNGSGDLPPPHESV